MLYVLFDSFNLLLMLMESSGHQFSMGKGLEGYCREMSLNSTLL